MLNCVLILEIIILTLTLICGGFFSGKRRNIIEIKMGRNNKLRR